MIFPKEYKTIGWTEKGKTSPDEQKRIYFLSEYILEKTAEGYNLYKTKHEGTGLIRKAKDSELVAGAEETVIFKEHLNIKNRTLLIQTAVKTLESENEKRKKASQKPATTVIFTGIDRHLTFVKDPGLSEISEIEVIDIIPPEPPWLADCVKRLDTANIFGDLQIRFTEKIADLSVYQGDKTIYPCRSSGLKGKFLDSDRIDENKDGWRLVGCDTSKKIAEALYPGLKYEFIEMCPMRSELTKPEKPFIMRCCKSENSGNIVKINGQTGIIVHWGTGEWQIAESIRKLALELQKNE
ncbi:MAG: hypothetical protein FWE78_03000 [Methanimicrococcus sp.]|nr:hypothetical protein [Methanimicrococcus sp.]